MITPMGMITIIIMITAMTTAIPTGLTSTLAMALRASKSLE